MGGNCAKIWVLQLSGKWKGCLHHAGTHEVKNDPDLASGEKRRDSAKPMVVEPKERHQVTCTTGGVSQLDFDEKERVGGLILKPDADA